MGVESKLGVGPVKRARDAIDGSGQRAAAGEREDADGVGADGVLFEAVDAVFLNGIVQERQRIPVIEEAGAGAENPPAPAVRLPGDAEARGKVSGRAMEGRGQALDFITQASDHGEPAGRPPLVLRPECGGVGGIAGRADRRKPGGKRRGRRA